MTRRLRAALVGVALAVVSLMVTVPASVILALYWSSPITQTESSTEGFSFSVSTADVTLVPSLVCAVLIFGLAFLWVQRRREAQP
jgi:hypothetical protein